MKSALKEKIEGVKQDPKTTIAGIVQIILMALVMFFGVTAEESSEIGLAVNTIIDSFGGTAVFVGGTAAAGIGSILLLFARRKDKKIK